MAKPIEINLTCYKGQTFTQNLYIKVNGDFLDLSEYTPKSQIRKAENSDELIAEFTCEGTSDGKLTLSLTSAITETLNQGFYKYDVKMTKDEEVSYWIRGTFGVVGRVTE